MTFLHKQRMPPEDFLQLNVAVWYISLYWCFMNARFGQVSHVPGAISKARAVVSCLEQDGLVPDAVAV